jgi:PKD repeat protein
MDVSDNTGVLWSFGDNTTSTEQNPVHTYTDAGSYEVNFTIFCNTSWFSESPMVITVFEPPVANFTVNRTFGSKPMTVQFTDSSTGSPPLNYSWDFGDGATSHEQNPIHTYTAAGSYQASLTVSNSAGNNTQTAEQSIDVLGPIGGDKGYYLVHSNVDGASVFLDDHYKGVIQNGTLLIQVYTTATPYYTYTIEKDGYQTFTAPITQHPAKGQTVDLYANLTPASGVGTLYISSYPPGATILINGTNHGTTNQFVSNVSAGARNLTLTKTGYQPYTVLVTVPEGETKILPTITLQKGEGPVDGVGSLYIASYPSNATILINGTDYGRTNQFVYNVPAGIQNLTLTKTGYQPYTLPVTILAGGTKILAPVTLSALPGGPPITFSIPAKTS